MAIKNKLQKIIPSSSTTIHRLFEREDKKLDQLRNEIRRSKERESNELYMMCMANHIGKVHYDTFHEYKDAFKGMEVAVIGSGPTLNYYVKPENVITLGCNSTYKYMKLDYYFVQDFEGEGQAFSIEEIKQLQSKKFVGHYIKNLGELKMHCARNVASYVGAKDYYVYDYFGRYINYQMPVDLENFPLVDNSSTIFSVMSFALFAHPSKIYIVGCDCSYDKGQHFNGNESIPMQVGTVYDNWKKIKIFIETFYSDIEVVSVNPVGLAGFFKDFYTENYIAEQVLN